MVQQPTAAAPLVLNFSGHIPALKNQKIPITTKEGKPALISNTTVQTFYRHFFGSGVVQIKRQGFSRLHWPTPVAAFCELWFYSVNDTGIAPSDADNAYTTLQELLIPANKKHPYYLGVIEDDKQVIDFRTRKYAVNSEAKEGARLFIWSTKTTGDGFDDLFAFAEFYRNYVNRSSNQPQIDLDEILTQLT